jgi:hypothetical protein
MSSVLRGFAQPVTQSFAASGSRNAWLHELDNIEGAFVPGSYTNVGSLYTVDTVTNLNTFITNLYNHSAGVAYEIPLEASLKDMGKNLIVGLLGGDSTLVTFRLVQLENQGPTAGYGGGAVGYTVVDNKLAVNQDKIYARAYRT